MSDTTSSPPVRRRVSVGGAALDSFFFALAGFSSVWLAVLLGTESLGLGWGLLWFAVL